MIKIYSTSFINPSHPSWKMIDKKITFENYSDWSKITTDIIYDKIIILFEEDIENEKNKYNNLFLKLFSKIQKNSQNNLIVFYISKQKNNINDLIVDKTLTNNKEIFKKKILSVSKNDNFIFVDVDKVFSTEGLKHIFEERNWYLFRSRLSDKGMGVLIEQIKRTLNHIKNLKKKLLILDCDNTLWGGVVGETGYNKIQIGEDGIGSAYLSFQQEIIKIKKQGVMLGICSKNNFSDVEEVFRKNKNMALKFNDFVIKKINWDEKYQNIKQIQKELNIGFDSMVFWDDNILERKKVSKFLPEVFVPEPSDDISDWKDQIVKIDDLYKYKLTADDLKKNKQYKMRAKFISSFQMKKDEISFLKSIKPKPIIKKLTPDQFNRASQLTLKVNQFNLTSIRLDTTDIKKIYSSKKFFNYLISFKDNFGDHGTIAFIILEKKNKNNFEIKNFSMSCRIIGRHLEAWALDQIFKIVKKNKGEFVEAKYIKTNKNKLCENFYDDHGMKLKSKSNKDKIYEANVKKTKVPFLQIYSK